MAQERVNTSEMKRFAIRVHPDTAERVRYWSASDGLSINAWIIEAIEEKIARANMDYPLPTLEQARLNQLIDLIKSQTLSMKNLEKVVLDMGKSITGLARGENYLLGKEDGEL